MKAFVFVGGITTKIMTRAAELLKRLGLTHCTQRHLQLIVDFVESGEKDCKVLLDKLGGWDANDLAITERWLNEASVSI